MGQWIVWGVVCGLIFVLIRDLVCSCLVAVGSCSTKIFMTVRYLYHSILGGCIGIVLGFIWRI